MKGELYRALHERAGWIERHDVGRLWVRGQDRRSYLHGLLTNDIEGLSAGSACYAALLTAQGRMITDMHVFERGDVLLVTLPRPLAGNVRDRLEQFVFSEDVQVEDATATTVQIGVYGPLADKIAGELPSGLSLTVMPGGDFGLHGFELITTPDGKPALVDALTEAGVVPVSDETVEACRIEAGVPRFLVDMTEETIPLEAGIEDRAISMTKGCYPGQEIIIRVLHRGGGRVARRLVRIGLPAGAPVPQRGAALQAAGPAEAGRHVGAVTSAAQSPALGRPIALGYVHRDFAERNTAVDVIVDGGKQVVGEVLGR